MQPASLRSFHKYSSSHQAQRRSTAPWPVRLVTATIMSLLHRDLRSPPMAIRGCEPYRERNRSSWAAIAAHHRLCCLSCDLPTRTQSQYLSSDYLPQPSCGHANGGIRQCTLKRLRCSYHLKSGDRKNKSNSFSPAAQLVAIRFGPHTAVSCLGTNFTIPCRTSQ